jgi:hypothetical protein
MTIAKSFVFSTGSFIVCIGFLLSSCSDENTFTVGDAFVESAAHMAIADTFTVETSTVVQDSVPTSGTNAMLIGNFEDTLFGDAGCSSFFQIGLPEGISLYDDDSYDSISLIIHYSGYFYGDTNKLMQIGVHRVTDDIQVREDGYLYNTSTFGYENDLMGSIRFRPMPKTADSLEIKISDAFGLELFNKFVSQSEDILTESDFLDYFKGIALIPEASSKNTIIGFKVAPEYLKIRLYTHRIDQTSLSTAYDFPLVYPGTQFNNITYDLSNTPLYYTQDQETSIPSSAAGNKAFVQGYKKIMTKLRFPSLPDVMLEEKGIIMRAELIFRPAKASYNDFALPNYVILYETNRRNQPGYLLYNSDGTVQTATLVEDDQYHEETYYTFDITNFINAEAADGYFDVDHGLLISLFDQNYQLNFERILIEAKSPAPKLKIYYLRY